MRTRIKKFFYSSSSLLLFHSWESWCPFCSASTFLLSLFSPLHSFESDGWEMRISESCDGDLVLLHFMILLMLMMMMIWEPCPADWDPQEHHPHASPLSPHLRMWWGGDLLLLNHKTFLLFLTLLYFISWLSTLSISSYKKWSDEPTKRGERKRDRIKKRCLLKHEEKEKGREGHWIIIAIKGENQKKRRDEEKKKRVGFRGRNWKIVGGNQRRNEERRETMIWWKIKWSWRNSANILWGEEKILILKTCLSDCWSVSVWSLELTTKDRIPSIRLTWERIHQSSFLLQIHFIFLSHSLSLYLFISECEVSIDIFDLYFQSDKTDHRHDHRHTWPHVMPLLYELRLIKMRKEREREEWTTKCLRHDLMCGQNVMSLLSLGGG